MDLEKLLAAFREMQELFAQRDEEIAKYGQVSENLTAQIQDLTNVVNQLKADAERLGYGGKRKTAKSLGNLFIDSNEAKTRFSNGVSLKFNTVISTDSAGETVTGTERASVHAVPTKRRITDLLPVISTNSNAIDFVEMTRVNRAGVTAEGSELPESDLIPKLKGVKLANVGHHLFVSKQTYERDSELVQFINNFLIEGVLDKRDEQIIAGTGLNGEMEGFLNNPKIQDVGEMAEGESMVDFIRKAITMVRKLGYHVDGIVLNPVDWEALELSREEDRGAYIIANLGGEDNIWKVPVIETAAIDEGTFLLGSFATCAAYRPYEEVTVEASRDHRFVENLYTIKAQEDGVLTVLVPEAFCKGKFY